MKRCPKCGCKSFTVTAHVTQDWKVNEHGDFVSCITDCVEVTHFPNDADIWNCSNCDFSAPGRDFNIPSPKDETPTDKTESDVPVKFRFYAVMEDGFEYSEIRDFSKYPSARELEDLLREFKREAEDMNDSVAVSFGTEYAGTTEKVSHVTIPDDMAAQFGTAEGRRKLMAAYGHINTAFSGTNQDGEQILLEISPDKIKYTCYQSNGWVRINWYDTEGNPDGETFDGRWKTRRE